MNRLKELRNQKGLTLDDIEAQTGIKRGTYSNYENSKTEPKLAAWQKLADFFNVSVPYLQGFDVSESNHELEYRKKLKQMAKSQLDMTEYNFHPSNNLDSGYGVTESVTAQLCIAANLIRVTESIEELSDKVGELNDTIHSYGMFVSSQP